MRQDFRFALRQLTRNLRPQLSGALALAVGIGATTATFSLLNGVAMRSLPLRDPTRLVAIRTLEFAPEVAAADNMAAKAIDDSSFPDFFDWRTQSGSFDGLATYSYARTRKFTSARTGRSEIIEGVQVSSDFFGVIGVMPQFGRPFSREDEKEGICPIIISHEFWMAEFDGSLKAIGGPIRMSDRPCTVVGVMPAGFDFPYTVQSPKFWDTIAALKRAGNTALNNRADRNIHVIARLRNGVSLRQADAELNSLQRGLAQTFPEDHNHPGASVVPLLDDIAGGIRKPLFLLLGAVAGVLLIACVNMAGLLLAKGVARRNEFSVRAALGASRAQIIRQVLIESTLLALLAGVCGVVIAAILLKLFIGFIPTDLPRLKDVRLDGMALCFSLLVSLITGVFFGVVPAWAASRTGSAFAPGGRSLMIGRQEQRIHGSLVVAEVAVGLVLLAGSGLLIRSFFATTRVNPGFDPHGLVTFRLGMSVVKFPADKATLFLHRVASAFAEIPGVESVTGAYPLPFTNDNFSDFRLEGLPSDPSNPTTAKLSVVQPLYFETLRVPLVQGRLFNERDNGSAKRVAIVNTQFARRFVVSGDVIGKFIEPADFNERHERYEIVGLVKSIRTTDLTEEPQPQFFLPYEQTGARPQGIILRVSKNPQSYLKTATSVIATMDRDVPVFDLSTMDDRIAQSTIYARFETQVLTSFAVVSLLLAAVGLYGTLSMMVARRAGEIGIRVALGAQEGNVFQLIVKWGLMMATIGAVIGLAGFWAFSRLLADMLYGISALDPQTIVLATLVLGCVAFAASAFPARRAARLNPMAALREQ